MNKLLPATFVQTPLLESRRLPSGKTNSLRTPLLLVMLTIVVSLATVFTGKHTLHLAGGRERASA